MNASKPEGKTATVNGTARRVGWFAFGLGLAAQVAQILTFRELVAVLHGSELVFGLILSCGLGWTALGGLVAGWQPAPATSEDRPAPTLVLCCACWGLVLCGQLLLLRWWAGTGALGAGQGLCQVLPAVVLFTAPAALLSGLQFVLALRMLSDASFGLLYRAESIGAVAGGMAFTFLLVSRGSPLLWSCLSAAILTLVGLWSIGVAGRRTRFLLAAAGAVYLVLAAFVPGWDARSTRSLWCTRLPGYGIEEAIETPYGRLTLLKSGAQVSIFQDATLIASIEPGAKVVETRSLADLCACLHPEPRRALVIGGTLGGLPRELLRHGVRTVEAVETDPALFELARRHGLLPEHPGVEYVGVDGRYFVKRGAPGTYDLLIVSPGLPESGTGNRFCTVEFFEAARRVLTVNGVLVLLLPAYGAAPEYQGGALLRRTASVWGAMRSAFAEVRAVPAEGHLLAGVGPTGSLTIMPAALGARIDAREDARPRLRVPGVEEAIPVSGQDYFAALFGGVLAVRPSLDGEDRQEGVAHFESALTGTVVAGNRDGHPVALAESLATGQEVAHGGTSWSAVVRVAAPITLALLLVAAGIGAALSALREKVSDRRPLLICAAATGLFGMAIEVLLLHAYQNTRGYVYGEVGGLIACFMAGLALGAHAGTRAVLRWEGAGKGLVRIVAGCILAAILLCVSLPYILDYVGRLSDSGGAAAIFWVLILMAGFLDGLTFPPLVALFGQDKRGFGGRAYAADLLGAGAGALLCGAIWLPAFGVWGACLGTAGVLGLAGYGFWARATR